MKMVVLGPQRSGSTFISQCLAKSSSCRHIDESEFDVYFLDWFFRIADGNESWVAHAPGLFVDVFKILERYPDVTFSIIHRPIPEILASQNRINLNDEKERQRLNLLSTDTRNTCEVKYMYWDMWKPFLPSWKEYNYRDFETHPDWVPDEKRVDFHPKQWEI